MFSDICAFDDRKPTFWQVDSLQAKLLEKLEQSLVDLQLNMEDIACASVDSSDPSEQSNMSTSVPIMAHEVSSNSLFWFLIFGCLNTWMQTLKK